MSFRISLVAIVMALGLAAQVQADELLQRKDFQFGAFNPPVLNVECSTTGNGACVDVETNTCTLLWVRWGEFVRQEKNCEGEPLEVIDRVPARWNFWSFGDRPCKEDAVGSPARIVRDPNPRGDLSFIIESHKGGYRFCFGLRPDEFECDDDAGWYRANASIYVCTMPIMDEELPAVICLD